MKRSRYKNTRLSVALLLFLYSSCKLSFKCNINIPNKIVNFYVMHVNVVLLLVFYIGPVCSEARQAMQD